jgi:hypothetical protein
MTSASAGYAPAATTLAQMRRPIIEPSPQLQLSTIIPTSKSSCCRLPGASTASNASADLPPHFPRHSIPHSGLAATSPPYLPRVRSLAAFGRRPPVDVAQLSMAGIRNPAQRTAGFRNGSKRDPLLSARMSPSTSCGHTAASAVGGNGPEIGIGGSLAAPPLPHHRAYGSVHGGSRSCANTRRTRMGDRAI